MSSYMVIRSVSDALRRILWTAVADDPVTQPLVGSEQAIVLLNPTQAAADSANRLSLWLYQIVEDEFVKNQPVERGSDQDERGRHIDRFPPMALDLKYLLTPFAASGEGDHLLLGLAMQTLYDNASTLLIDEAAGVAEELRIIFHRHSLEELTRIWDALKEPYRLSLGYQVRVTRLDSGREHVAGRVLQLDSDSNPIPVLS